MLSNIGSFFWCLPCKNKASDPVTELEAQLFVDATCKDEASIKSFRSFLLREFNFCVNNSMILPQIASRSSNFWGNQSFLYRDIQNHNFGSYDPAVKKVYLQIHDQEVFCRLQQLLTTSESIQDKAYSLKNLYGMSWGVCMLDLAQNNGLNLFTDLIADLSYGKVNTKKWKHFFTCYKKFINMPMFPYLLIDGGLSPQEYYFSHVTLNQCMVINTPLIVAVQKNNESLTEWLVRQGAIVDARNSDNKTALMVAAYRNNYRFVRFLLECKADLSLSDCGRKAYDYTTQDSVKNILHRWELMQQEKEQLAHEEIPSNLSCDDIDDFIYGVLSVMAKHPIEMRLRSLLTSSAYRCINRMHNLFDKIQSDGVLVYLCKRIKFRISDEDRCNKLIDTLYWFANNYISQEKIDIDFDYMNE